MRASEISFSGADLAVLVIADLKLRGLQPDDYYADTWTAKLPTITMDVTEIAARPSFGRKGKGMGKD